MLAPHILSKARTRSQSAMMGSGSSRRNSLNNDAATCTSMPAKSTASPAGRREPQPAVLHTAGPAQLNLAPATHHCRTWPLPSAPGPAPRTCGISLPSPTLVRHAHGLFCITSHKQCRVIKLQACPHARHPLRTVLANNCGRLREYQRHGAVHAHAVDRHPKLRMPPGIRGRGRSGRDETMPSLSR
jgi:hypothetical protein